MSDRDVAIVRQFDSIHKFVDHVEKVHDKNGSSTEERDYDGESWHGTASMKEAIQFAKFGGWEPAHAGEMRATFDDLVPKLRKFTDMEMERRYDVQGDQVDVSAYVMGEPDHMIGWVPDESAVTKRALCLVIGHSVSGGCTADDLFKRGSAAIALVRALSLLGYELEIWSEETVTSFGRGGNYTTLVRLHAAGEVMDESAVEFAIGNPSWLRRLLFGSQEGESDVIRKQFGFRPGGGYGSVTEIQHAGYLNADLELNLGRTWFSQRDKEAPLLWVFEQMKALGVVPEDAELDDD